MFGILGATALGVGLVQGPAVGAPPAPPQAPAVHSLQEKARISGQREEIPELTNATTQVFANPDGTRTWRQHPQPVRSKQGDRWVPVDTVLRADADGVRPKAAAVPVVLSGGGTNPLVRMSVPGKPGEEMALSWPTPLPRPVLDKDVATYPNVLPDVDLRVRATPEGFTHSLIVKTAPAAANPALREVQFGLKGTGLKFGKQDTGAIEVTNSAGEGVFVAPSPIMWDAESGPAPSEHSTAQRRSVLGVDLGADRLVLRPDQKLLADPATKFPVEIDPGWAAKGPAWALVYGTPASYQGNTYWYGDSDKVAKVGYSQWEVPVVKVRTFFQFNTADLRGKEIISAGLNLNNIWSSSCNARRVFIDRTPAISQGTNWVNQPNGPLDTYRDFAHGWVDDNGVLRCAPAWEGFGVVGAVRASTEAGWTTTTLRVTADEGDTLAWKKFDANNASLEVTYNTPPYQATNLYVDTPLTPNMPCNGEIATNAPRPILHATVTDPDGDSVDARFQWRKVGSDRTDGYLTRPMQSSGSVLSMTLPEGVLTKDGDKVAWNSIAGDGRIAGPESPWCTIAFDQTKPGAPKVTSDVYKPFDPTTEDGTVSGSAGQTGSFTFEANGTADVSGFYYRTSESPTPRFVPADKLGGRSWAEITPSKEGDFDVWVASADRARNVGPEVNFHFFVGQGTPPVAHWNLDGHRTDTVAADLYGRHSGPLAGPAGAATWTTGRVGDALRLNGQGYVSTEGGHTVLTNQTFAVSAWVKLDNADGTTRVAVSQDGTSSSGFSLGYNGERKAFEFVMPQSDGGALDRAISSKPAVPGVWTHVLGMADRGNGRELRLYVNGEFVGRADHKTIWDAQGSVQLGRGKSGGAYGSYWAGALDDVKLYTRLPSVLDRNEGNKQILSEVHALATTPTVLDGEWGFDEAKGTRTEDLSANGRTGVLGSGVGWAQGRVGPGAASFDGSGGAIDTGRPGVRTDGSFTVTAHVRLKTTDEWTRAAVSQDATDQDGNTGSGFYLMYWPKTKGWAFSVWGGGAAESPNLARAGEWASLAGVYDLTARQLRLYVDGALIRSTAIPPEAVPKLTSGNLLIGRDRYDKRPSDFWNGDIDQVRTYVGVRTDDQIKQDAGTKPDQTSLYNYQFTRWTTHNGERSTGNRPMPAGYHLERGLGLPAPADAPDTRLLYKCDAGGGEQMSSADPNCEGQRYLGVLGRVYQNPPAGVATQPLYRCNGPWLPGVGDHFESNDPKCEGGKVEGLMGYTVAGAMLIRYASTSAPWDHASSTVALPGRYAVEGPLGFVANAGTTGTTTLMNCLKGSDYFSSLDPKCEGATVVGPVGAVWPKDPSGDNGLGLSLHRCRTADGDRLDSLEAECEGLTPEQALGYTTSVYPLPPAKP
nr:serine/threonine protein kinase [Kibdelosporangium sp. MJ126-NF4]CTQ97126.1 serine/threonine protein kinase [Kibdelosporangium sp. MJ126-NF4]